MKVVDLFAGPGGWSEGMASIGIRDIGLEWDADACATRAAAGHATVRCDVGDYPPDPFVGFDSLVASPPCQAFSMAGNRKGVDDLARIHNAITLSDDGWRDEYREAEWEDERSRFILEPLRWVWTVRPTWIACEQVPPCMPVWEHMAHVLRGWGYQAIAVKLLAADYGVPQTRLRAFLLAHREELRVAEPTHAKVSSVGLFGERLPWVTMAEALGWDAGYLNPGRTAAQPNRRLYAHHETAPTVGFGNDHANWVRTSFGEPHRGKEAGSPKPEFDPVANPCRTVNGKTGDWTRSRPAPTFTGGGTDTGGAEPFAHPSRWPISRPSTSVQSTDRIGRPGHEDFKGGESQFDKDAVRITQEEAAILQGFRPDYPFQGSKTSRFRQIGNAVPPTWASAIIGALAGVSTDPGQALELTT